MHKQPLGQWLRPHGSSVCQNPSLGRAGRRAHAWLLYHSMMKGGAITSLTCLSSFIFQIFLMERLFPPLTFSILPFHVLFSPLGLRLLLIFVLAGITGCPKREVCIDSYFIEATQLCPKQDKTVLQNRFLCLHELYSCPLPTQLLCCLYVNPI